MQIFAVILATVAAYGFGAFWYIRMAKPWMAAAGVPVDATGKPVGGRSPLPFIVGFLAELLVAGMMRHIFVQAQLNTLPEGIMGGFGIGTFLIAPWVAMNYAFAGRPYKLSLLDGVNSVVGCTIMGIILSLFL
jgi:hypothetical protein